MSVQFGNWNLDGSSHRPDYVQEIRGILAPHAVDGTYSFAAAGMFVDYLPFHSTQESHQETQPFVSPSGLVFTWDGRLDNRAELLRQSGAGLSADASDVAIVEALFRRLGTDSLAKFIGDWALSIWNPRARSLLLARDFLGTRQLYFSAKKDCIIWCTVLDPLVATLGRSFEIDEEYIAGWLSSFPGCHLTPFTGLSAVPPSSYIFFREGSVSTKSYWNFDSRKSVRYSSDQEYEEHFRSLFAQSVRRRLRSDRPVLAELSGGMDSSSIVCVADALIANGSAETPRLDTISYYDDSEPNWNERPYFQKVEEQRGRVGCHIDVGAVKRTAFEYDECGLACLPGSGGRPTIASEDFAACLLANSNRVLLSGLGGDEVLGGVPAPVPELGDLLITGHFVLFLQQLLTWALSKRVPVFHLIGQMVRRFLTAVVRDVSESKNRMPWLEEKFVNKHRGALGGYNIRWKLFGSLPSFQESISTLDALRRQISCSTIPHAPPYEKRYPYLDRDLLEFLYAIPREQLVRPHMRRSLMRRALRGIVPAEILDRKRKAYLVRGTLVALAEETPFLLELSHQMVSASLGIVSPEHFRGALDQLRQGHEINVIALTRTLNLEAWLRHVEPWHGSFSRPGSKQQAENADSERPGPNRDESSGAKSRGTPPAAHSAQESSPLRRAHARDERR